MHNLELIGFLLIVRSFFCDCNWEPQRSGFVKNQREFKVNRAGRLFEGFKESSGIIPADTAGNFWIHQDSGGDNQIYLVGSKGEYISSLEIPNSSNIDWEDIAKDDKGNLYVGDFGNNQQKRKNLRIYKVNPLNQQVDTISFSYKDQQEFPPTKKKNRNFDCEAFFWHQGQLHLFSKNRGKKLVKYYKLPDLQGKYEIEPVEEFFLNGMITAADISPDGNSMALLTYGKIYFFDLKPNQPVFANPYKCIDFFRAGQAEALAFVNNNELIITNEQGKVYVLEKRRNKKKI
jgi:hypothetical protein